MVPCWAFDPTCFHRKYFHSVVTNEQPYFNNKYLWGIIMLNVSDLQRSPPRSPHFLHGRATQLTCLRQRIIDRKGTDHLRLKYYCHTVDDINHRIMQNM